MRHGCGQYKVRMLFAKLGPFQIRGFPGHCRTAPISRIWAVLVPTSMILLVLVLVLVLLRFDSRHPWILSA